MARCQGCNCICAEIPCNEHRCHTAGGSAIHVDEIKLSVETFVKAGETCKKAGIQFAFHNHATEWDQVEGKTPYELILSQTDKDLVNNKIVAIGQGSVNFKSTFAAAKSAGMKYYFYEQDSAKSMDDVSLSYNNLSKII